MKENERDTENEVRDGLYCGHPIEPLEDRLAHWEAMRPSVVRRKAIEVIVAPKTTDNKPVKIGNISPKKLEKLYSFFNSLDRDIENGIATCLAAKFNLCVPDVFRLYEEWQIADQIAAEQPAG